MAHNDKSGTVPNDPNKKKKQADQKQPDRTQNEEAGSAEQYKRNWNQDSENQVVNDQEQNLPVNPDGGSYREGASGLMDVNKKSGWLSEEEEPQKPEIDPPHKIDGDDADSTERKIPNF
jgi:hypothetical protein